ncbi:hypothetical protein TNIN_123151 [Trichonephila inaurata madagascariensis]|uniref:Uncharacterized protein n=1 Tax=Trichonephila inaurata madagascariensis TaxID=2747483 RepID=A0A8X7C0U5_9ARAC|nr:hypothetical protein TNIN_123151 [Trichonephila inaurata madagascariensis]
MSKIQLTLFSKDKIHYIQPVDPCGVKVVALMISINRSPLLQHSLPSIGLERAGFQVQAMEWLQYLQKGQKRKQLSLLCYSWWCYTVEQAPERVPKAALI